MLLEFLFYLKQTLGIKVPHVFFYTSTRMLLAALTSLLFSLCLGPLFIKKLYALKIGQTIRTDECPLLGALHRNKQNTPTMGGILLLSAMLASWCLWIDVHSVYSWILLLTTLSLGFMGGLDDYLKLKHQNTKGLSGRKKVLFQVTLSLLIAAYFLFPSVSSSVQLWLGLDTPVIKFDHTTLSTTDYMTALFFPFLKSPVLYFATPLAFAWITLVITGSSNAVNLTDGLDGLASGCLLMVTGVFCFIAFISNHVEMASYLHILYIEGSGEIAVFLAAMLGAVLGFLWYNGHPAQLFMGDIGSLTLGGIIGVSALLLRKEILLAIVGGIFVLEALSVILQVASFKLRGQRIFLCAPLHHHFEYKGWPETKVVTRFWIISLLLALFGLATLKFQ